MSAKPLEDHVVTSSSEEETEGNSSSEEDVSSGPHAVKEAENDKSKVSESESGSDEETDSDSETSPVKVPVVKLASETKKVEASSAKSAGENKKVESSSTKSASKNRKTEASAKSSGEAKMIEPSSAKPTGEPKKVEPKSKKRSAESNGAEAAAKKVKKEDVKKHGEGGEAEASAAKSSATLKRSKADEAEASAKRVKVVCSGEDEKKSGVEEETGRKNYFIRVWSEADEIALLQGTLHYKEETGANPYGDTNRFYHQVRKYISFDVSKTQFMEKLRSLKKKFENNVGKGKKKNGEDPSFAKTHDQKTFHLSKSVWGADGILALESAVKSARKLEKIELVKEDELPIFSLPKEDFSSIIEAAGRLGVNEKAVQRGWSRLGSEFKKRFKEHFEAVEVDEMKVYARKSALMHELLTEIAETPNP